MARIRDRIGSALLFLICALAWSRSERFPADAIVFPRIVITLLAIFSTAMLVKTFIKDGASVSDQPFFINGRRFAISAVAIVAYVFAVSVLGYFTVTIVFIPLMAWSLGYRRGFPLVLMAASFCLVVFLVFVTLFERPLPPEWILKIL